jgi:hypothetical protein
VWAVFFIDLQKAFDCVHHSVLIEKLKAAGLTGEALALFKSTAIRQINGKSSRQHSLTYIISNFINNIFNIPLLGKIQLYAGDAVQMYAAGRTGRTDD